MIDNISEKTFRHNRLVIELHPEVYEPAEDSFLLLKALKINHGDKVLELGTGCGLISLECARRGAHVMGTDLNPFAVQLTRRNLERNRHMLKGIIEIREGDMFSVVKDQEFFDVILFNPPYLPTSEEEKVGGWFDIATDGGKDGLEITKRFNEEVKKHLSENGRAYFVFSSLSDPSKLEKYLNKEGLHYKVLLSQNFDFETIEIYCLTR